MNAPISLGDWKRLLIGDAPFVFLLEVLLRTLLIYVCMMFILRWMGKRMGGQISNLELGVMMVLGAIVSFPMLIPRGGLLPAAALMLGLLGLQRGLSAAAARSAAVERLVEGKPSILVRDGVLLLDALAKSRISRWQLFSTLRSEGVRHLGELKRVYLESSGSFTVLRAKKTRPGLSVLPTADEDLQRDLPKLPDARACADCGAIASAQSQTCARCHGARWSYAVGDAS